MSNQDFFTKRFAGKQIQIKKHGQTLTKMGNDPQTCYSQKLIQSQNTGTIYMWTFKIIQRQHELVIGISSNHKSTDGAFYHNMKDINYGYSVENGQKVSKNKYSDYGCKCNKNDTIEMILNLQKKQLSFRVNDMDQGVMYSDVQQDQNIKYRLAIFTQGSGTSITLQKYQEITIQKEQKEETLTQHSKTSNMKYSNNTLQKILKQLEEQRAAQQKMDKRLKSIVEAMKDMKATLEQQQNNNFVGNRKYNVMDKEDAEAICPKIMRNLKIGCYVIFVLLLVIGMILFRFGSYFGIKKDL